MGINEVNSLPQGAPGLRQDGAEAGAGTETDV